MNRQKVSFKNRDSDQNLSGILYTPNHPDISRRYPAVVVSGPMLSVKDQAQSVYTRKLAENSYVTLVFDRSYFGESEGQPRHPELPSVKETDIVGATTFLQSIPFVDPDAIGGLGICGSGPCMSVFKKNLNPAKLPLLFSENTTVNF